MEHINSRSDHHRLFLCVYHSGHLLPLLPEETTSERGDGKNTQPLVQRSHTQNKNVVVVVVVVVLVVVVYKYREWFG